MIAKFKLGLGLDIVSPNSMMDTSGSGLYSPNVLKNDEENWKMFKEGLKSTKYGADNCVIIGVVLKLKKFEKCSFVDERYLVC